MSSTSALVALQGSVGRAEGLSVVVGLGGCRESDNEKVVLFVDEFIWQLYTYVSGCTYQYQSRW